MFEYKIEIILKKYDKDKHGELDGILGFVAGALFCLKEREKMNCQNSTKEQNIEALRYIKEGRDDICKWLEGFYFNAAIHRISYAFERICKIIFPKEEDTKIKKIKKEIKKEIKEKYKEDEKDWEVIYKPKNINKSIEFLKSKKRTPKKYS